MMATAKPEQWVSALLTRFEEQLPCRIGPQTHHSRINVQQNKESLIHISKWKFSLVISGLTRTLSKVNFDSYLYFIFYISYKSKKSFPKSLWSRWQNYIMLKGLNFISDQRNATSGDSGLWAGLSWISAYCIRYPRKMSFHASKITTTRSSTKYP